LKVVSRPTSRGDFCQRHTHSPLVLASIEPEFDDQYENSRDAATPALVRQLLKRALEIDQKAEAVHWRRILISAPDPQGPATSK
jgi:hypothetical protein